MAAESTLNLIIGVVDKASGPLGTISGGLGKIGTLAAGFATGAAVAGVGALSAALVTGIGDAREANLVMAQTEAVIKSTGGAAGFTADEIAEMSGALSAAEGKSLFGDSDIQKGQNLLLTFTNIKDVMPDATQTMLDMAQALGTDASGSAVQLGKALNDPINGISALSRVGVTFTEEQKEQIKTMQEAGDMAGAQQVILAELNKEFGGSAEAAAKADGGMAMFKDRMGELAESVGAQVLPALNNLMAWLNSPEVQAAIEAMVKALVDGLGAAFTWLGDVALPALKTAFETVWPIIHQAVSIVYEYLANTVWPWLRDVAFPWIVDVGLPALQSAFETVWPIIQQAVGAVYTFLSTVVWPWLRDTAFPWLQNTALPALRTAFETVWPIIQQAVKAVYDFFHDVVWPWLSEALRNTTEKEIPAIRKAFETAWPIIQKAVTTVYEFLRDDVWPWLQTATTNIVTWINTAQQGWSDAWSLISGAVTGAKNTISGVIETIKSLVQGAIDKINALIRLINSVPGVELPTIPGGSSGGSSGFGAQSISVGSPVPLGGFSGTGQAGGGYMTNTFVINQQPGQDSRVLAAQVADEIDRRNRIARTR